MAQEPTSTPTTNTPAPAPAAAPQHGDSKKPLLIGGGIVAILVVLIAVWMLFFQGPNKEDYRKAYEAMQEVRNTYSASGSAALSSISRSSYGSSSSSANADRFQESFNKYKDAAAKLKDLKVMTGDNEIKEKYDAFTKKNETFEKKVDELMGSMDKMQSVSEDCGNVRRTSVGSSDKEKVLAEYDETASKCTKAMEGLKDAKSDTIRNLGAKGTTAMKEMRKAFVEMLDAVEAKDSSRLSKANLEFRQKARTLTEATSDFSRNLRREFSDADVNTELNALGRTVTNRYNDVNRG